MALTQVERHRRYAKSHPEKIKECKRRWNKTPGKKNGDLKRKFGITFGEYQQQFAEQGGCCAICGDTYLPWVDKRFAVDHDHKRHKIRGLLCTSCNLMLGQAKDESYILQKGADYLDAQS